MQTPPLTIRVICLLLLINIMGCQKVIPPPKELPRRILILDPGVVNVDLKSLILMEAKGIGESIASLDIYLMASTVEDPAPRLIRTLSPQVGPAISGNIRGALRTALESANLEAIDATNRAVAEEIQAQQSRKTPKASPILESWRCIKRRTDSEPGIWEVHFLMDCLDVFPGTWSWEKAKIGAPESIRGWQAYCKKTGGPIAFPESVSITCLVPTAINIGTKPLLTNQIESLQAAWKDALKGSSKVVFKPIESNARTNPSTPSRRS